MLVNFLSGVYSASNSMEDINAGERNLIWNGGWYADPLYFGDYPEVMKKFVGSRLPKFTSQEKELIKNSVDYFGLNHYQSTWVWYCNNFSSNASDKGKERTWYTDSESCVSAINPYNNSVIGPTAASDWLVIVPKGIYKVADWVYSRYMNGNESSLYSNQDIYITENGVDPPNENETHVVLNDTFKINFLENYISYVMQAHNDGLNVNGYFVWSLLDNFEWADGFQRRFGIHAVNYTSPNRTRTARQSAYWYTNFIKNNP